MTEDELRNHLVIYLGKQGITEIEIEVPQPGGARMADLVYLKDGEVHVVEVKKYFNEKLYSQVNTWKRYTQWVWVFVMTRGRKNIENYIEKGVGIIIWNNSKFDILAIPDKEKDPWFVIENREKFNRRKSLIDIFKRLQQQEEKVIKQKCYHSFRCQCNEEVYAGWTQYVKFYRDELGLLRAKRCCVACGDGGRL